VNVIRDIGNRQRLATEAFRSTVGHLGWQPMIAVPHLVFPGGEGAFPSVFDEIGIGAPGKYRAPCPFEIAAGLIKGRGGSIGANPAVRRRIETAVPTPLININRNTGTSGDRADAGIAMIDVPTVLAFRIAAAGESGHAVLKRGREA
jgi:hypothetical protein